MAGTRWIIEDAFKAKQEVGLDEYQVRLRLVPDTLAMLAHAFLW